MSAEPFDKLNLGVGEKYNAVFSAISSGDILTATEPELADHARALASYHFDHSGQDQLAASLLIHNLQWARITERISAQTDMQTRRITRLTWALLFFTAALFVIAVIQTKIMFKQNADTHKQQIQSSKYEQTPSTNK